jgi:hypothetical protein
MPAGEGKGATVLDATYAITTANYSHPLSFNGRIALSMLYPKWSGQSKFVLSDRVL